MCSSARRRHAASALLLAALLGGALAGEVRGQEAETPSLREEVRRAFRSYAFTLESERAPRWLFRGGRRTVRLTVRNDGSEGWQPEERVSVSYHWLSAEGELVQREGVRTRVPRPVASGESVEMEVEVRAPERLGFYRLQWDMVQEGVAWFSTFDPTPAPDRWVLVLPRSETLLSSGLPLAAVVAALALALGRRRGRSAGLGGVGDLLWCGAALFGKPHALYLDLAVGLEPGGYWITASWAAVALLALALVPRRLRPLGAWLLVALVTLVVWGDAIHFRFFEDLVTAPALRAAGQTGELIESAFYLALPRDWLLLPDLLVALPLVGLLAAGGRAAPAAPAGRWRKLAVLALALLPGLAVTGYRAVTDGLPSRLPPPVRWVERSGLYAFQAGDLMVDLRNRVFRPPLSSAEYERIVEAFRRRAPARAGTGDAFGAARGMNLLAVQAESLQQFVLDLEIDGQEITPFLNRLAASSLYFPSTQDQTGRGRSSAGDFVNFTSLIPATSSIAYEFPGNRFATLTDALAARGYRTLSAIPFRSTFWNRRLTHPAYGFAESWFEERFEPGLEIGWGLNDLDFFRQMGPRIAELEEPYFLWLTTLSLHFPFTEFPAELEALDLGRWQGTALGNYLHAMNLFDRALAELVRDLEARGLRERTVLAVWGDHDSGLHHRHDLARVIGFRYSRLGRFLVDRVPLVISVPGEGAPRGRYPRRSGHVDIAPTLMALLGIDPAGWAFQGRNLLGSPDAVPMVHPLGSWVDDHHVFLREQVDEPSSCWRLDDLVEVDLAECDAGNRLAAELLEVSEKVLRYDLQTRITVDLGGAAGD